MIHEFGDLHEHFARRVGRADQAVLMSELCIVQNDGVERSAGTDMGSNDLLEQLTRRHIDETVLF